VLNDAPLKAGSFPRMVYTWSIAVAGKGDMPRYGLSSQERRSKMDALTLLVMLGVLVTVVVLFTGIGSMAEGGEFDDRHSHQLMFARVGVQAFTLLLVIIALLLFK
jgi:hypothetical protein